MIKLHPGFVKNLASKMVDELSGELKSAYAETLEKVGSEKTIKMILHDRAIRKELDLRDPAVRKYMRRIVEKLVTEEKEPLMTINELSNIFGQFII